MNSILLSILLCYYLLVIVVIVLFDINVHTITAFTIPTTRTLSGTLTSTSLCMFTGIVEEIGTVVKFIERTDMTMWDGTVQKGYEMTIQCNNNNNIDTIDATTTTSTSASTSIILDDAYIGCSICVSGVCLTVTEYNTTTNTFIVGIAPETMKCTYFPLFLQQAQHAEAQAQEQYYVNLERAAPIGGRNSGHTVQGHVDCTGTIQNKITEGNTLKYTIQLDNDNDSSDNNNNNNLISCIVPKGYVAIDGTSLTVIDVNYSTNTFTFMLIEYTQKHIIIPYKNINDKVNIEVDVLAKYAQQVQQVSTTQAQSQLSIKTTTSSASLPENDDDYLQQLEKRIQVLEEALLIRNDK